MCCPEPSAGKSGAAGAWRGRSIHQDPIRGPKRFPASRPAPDEPRLGSEANRASAQSWMHAARAKSGASAARSLDGRVRERCGGPPVLHSTTRVTHRPDPSRALHVRPYDRNALGVRGRPSGWACQRRAEPGDSEPECRSVSTRGDRHGAQRETLACEITYASPRGWGRSPLLSLLEGGRRRARDVRWGPVRRLRDQ